MLFLRMWRLIFHANSGMWGLFLMSLGLIACDSSSGNETLSTDKQYTFTQYPREATRSGIELIYNRFKQRHFDPFHAHRELDWEALVSRQMASLPDSMNAMEYYLHCLPVFNLLRDAHSFLLFPFDYSREFAAQGGTFIPIEADIRDGVLYVKNDLSGQGIPPYSLIHSVGGVPAKKIVEDLSQMLNNERQEAEEDYMAHFFPHMLFPLYGLDSSFSVAYTDPDGRKQKIELAGISPDSFPRPYIPDFRFYTSGDSLGIMDINRCENKAGFAAFCDSVFRELKEQGIDHLVIDVRDNPGGSTYHGDTLFTYLTDKPFSQYGKVQWAERIISITETKVIMHENQAVEAIARANSLRFKGKVYMLCNRFTFSSAAMMAATFQCYNMGFLIGEETGGHEVFFDEPEVLEVPSTSLRFLISYQKRWSACGESMEHGVLPDIEVNWSVEDARNGRDAAMEVVKDLVQ